MEYILFRDIDQMIIHNPLLRLDLIEAVGMRYAVQKNHRNGQVIWYSRDATNPSFCPVVHAFSLVCCAVKLRQSPCDPICVYQDTTDDTIYLTGISSHWLQVTTCVLLEEASMLVYFIKLCLRWISDCFEVFIRNTLRMANMHNVAITKPPTVLSTTNLGLNLVSDDDDGGLLDDYELEDDD